MFFPDPLLPDTFTRNFKIPSKAVLSKQSQPFHVDAQTPGVLNEPLKAFAKSRGKVDVKLSFDGGKLATGYGKKLGEEDLGGYEEPSTLQERKLRLDEELQICLSLKKTFPQSANPNNVVNFSKEDKALIIKGMTVLSVHIKELRV